MIQAQRIVKHKATVSPLECHHCGVIWYGIFGSGHKDRPPDTVLCTACGNRLWDYLYYDGPHCKDNVERDKSAFQQISAAWIVDKTQKPLPRSEQKRFDHSVPRWMRKAINLGLVKPNDKDIYIISTVGDEPVCIEKQETDAMLNERLQRNEKPFKRIAVPFWQSENA